MEPYSKFTPTPLDGHITLEDREHWLVAPVGRTRDSDALTRSNFEVLEGMLGEADESGDGYEVHRFGHWGPGWFEIVIVDPDRDDLVQICTDAESALDDYPVLDEDHFSQLEHDERWNEWTGWAHRVFVDLVTKEFSLSDAAWVLLDRDADTCLQWLDTDALGGSNYGGSEIYLGNVDRATREQVAELLREIRRRRAGQGCGTFNF